jgi:ubiquinone/menaquinone biosynthesis C-methylase UbiE
MDIEKKQSFYGPAYFDGKVATTSNYHGYGHENISLDVRFALSALHAAIETQGLNFSRKLKIVDLGGAKGIFASWLSRFLPNSTVYNSDWSHYAVQNALPEIRHRSFVSDVRHVPVGTGTCNLVGCVDVLEHISTDTIPSALQEIRRVLKPSGKAIIIPNTGEDAATSIDQSHISIYPPDWWQARFIENGLVSENTLTQRFARSVGGIKNIPWFPTLRPGFFIVHRS